MYIHTHAHTHTHIHTDKPLPVCNTASDEDTDMLEKKHTIHHKDIQHRD